MKRLIQRDLMRGRTADRAALALILLLLTVLAASLIHGMRTLPT